MQSCVQDNKVVFVRQGRVLVRVSHMAAQMSRNIQSFQEITKKTERKQDQQGTSEGKTKSVITEHFPKNN